MHTITLSLIVPTALKYANAPIENRIRIILKKARPRLTGQRRCRLTCWTRLGLMASQLTIMAKIMRATPNLIRFSIYSILKDKRCVPYLSFLWPFPEIRRINSLASVPTSVFNSNAPSAAFNLFTNLPSKVSIASHAIP